MSTPNTDFYQPNRQFDRQFDPRRIRKLPFEIDDRLVVHIDPILAGELGRLIKSSRHWINANIADAPGEFPNALRDRMTALGNGLYEFYDNDYDDDYTGGQSQPPPKRYARPSSPSQIGGEGTRDDDERQPASNE